MGSWLFGKTTTAVNTTPTPASSLRIQTSMQGRPISMIWGTQRIAGNLIFNGGFVAIPQYQTTITSSSSFLGHIFTKAQSTTTLTGYIYRTGVAFGLCYGEITAVLRAWNGTTSVTAAALGFVTFTGTTTQSAWTYPPVNQQLNYRGVAYVANSAFELGTNPSLPMLNFEVESGFLGYGPTGQDANPKDVVIDILTNHYYGIDFPPGRLDLTMQQYSDYCVASGMIGSPIVVEQTSAQTFLAEIMESTNSVLRWSNGRLTAVPWGVAAITANGATYTPDVTPVYDFDDDDFMENQGGSIGSGGGGSEGEPITFVRTRQSDKLNIIKVEYLDRSNNYDPVALDAKDEASIDKFGERPSSLFSRHMFTGGGAAQQSAYLQLIREQIDGLYSFTLPPQYILLDVEDIVTLTRPVMGLNAKAVRIVEIQENEDYTLTFTAEEFLGTTSGTYGLEPNSGSANDINADPGGISSFLIFHPPDALAAPAANETAIWIALCGLTPSIYGGSVVWMSGDGISYSNIGTANPCTMGFATAQLPNHADPDNVNTLSLNLTESQGVLDPGTAANLALGIPTCWLDTEIIAYQNAALVSSYLYNLTTLRRALYGSSAALHIIGSRFALLDVNVFRMTVPSSLVGSTVYFKFQPYNIFLSGSPDLSTLPAHPYVVGTNPTAAWPYVVDTVIDRTPDTALAPSPQEGDNFVLPEDSSNIYY